jgi:hypothetical protein
MSTQPVNPPPTGEVNNSIKQSEKAINVIVYCIILGIIISLIYSSQAAGIAQFMAVEGTALAVSGAALFVGGLLGFLFGIPKKLQQDSSSASNQQKDNDTDKNTAFQQNTNLEQISDWLTKILVGIGLTELGSIPSALQKYSDFAATGLGGFTSSKVFAIALLLYFLICGFLITYLWTRLYLAEAFQQAEQAAQGPEANEKIKQLEHDAHADKIVDLQILQPHNAPPIKQEDLDAAINWASDREREAIYNKVWDILKEHPENQKVNPILLALIASDPQNYLYHASRAYALAYQISSNPKDVEDEFTTAINLRPPWRKYDDIWIELNRAQYHINQDQNFKNNKRSDDLTKNNILVDLRSAASNPVWKISDWQGWDSINEWISKNKITDSDLH